MLPLWKIVLISASLVLAAGHEAEDEDDGGYGINSKVSDKNVFRAIVESCGG